MFRSVQIGERAPLHHSSLLKKAVTSHQAQRAGGGKKLLTPARSQDDRVKPTQRSCGGLARTAPARLTGSSGGEGSAHRRGRPGFSRGEMQAPDCISRPWEGTDFRPQGENLGVEYPERTVCFALRIPRRDLLAPQARKFAKNNMVRILPQLQQHVGATRMTEARAGTRASKSCATC